MWFLIILIMMMMSIPQMSPMNWIFLFMLFNFSFYLLVVKNYFFMNKLVFKK